MPLRQLLDVPAPAKLNLFLHVVGRRPDGYHLLQSVFVLIDWYDTLHFERRDDGRISREDLGAGLPLPDDDLTVQAARLLQQHTGCRLGVHIGLDKHIPVQAGLGGGSSDAASTLLALNRLWQLGLDACTLARLGLQLGADVPFFIGGQTAWVEGIGEDLTPVACPHDRFLVVKPLAGLSTPAIFGHPALKRDTKRATITDFVAHSPAVCQPTPAHPHHGHVALWGANDLQAVASALCADVAQGLQWFEDQGLSGRMTGSGTALFAALGHRADASELAHRLSGLPTGWTGRVCNNLRVHPLFEWR
jgi:4-diphosphocytidyl-2-C-methyl-D-erythritol kinase